MEAHSVSAAPHNCRRVGITRGHKHSWAERYRRPTLCCFIASLCFSCLRRQGRVRLYWAVQSLRKMLVRVFKSSVTRRSASQVCVPQLVLWIRPMTHTSYNPAISQHQGGPAPLPTRRGPASARRSRAGRAQVFSPTTIICVPVLWKGKIMIAFLSVKSAEIIFFFLSFSVILVKFTLISGTSAWWNLP